MTFTFLDIALPIGLGAVFGVFRYVSRLKTDPENALSKSAADAIKGTLGLAVITFIIKYITPS
jgi:hypothetical protein